jgi:ornithine cyclodeaminase
MSSESRLLMLNADAVAAYLQPDDVLAAVHEAFILHSEDKGRVFPVIRERLSTGGVFGIKAGDVQSEGLLGFKAAGFWPSNRNLGSEPHQATIMLIDPATGRPVCVIDGNAITTARTAAAGAVGLQQLARPDSIQLCVFGTGVQARAQVDYALRVLPDIQCLRYVSSDRKPNASFESHFEGRLAVECVADADTAVSRSDVIITTTPGGGPLFSAKAVKPGTHLNAVGTDTKGKRELPEGLLPRVRLVVDDLVQSRQIGESQWAPDTPCIEIGDLFTGKATLERAPTDITLFDLTGLALQDLTVARLIHQKAQTNGQGIEIHWPW